jgi:uncharacterized protein YdeI (YjbR/CyaY-like superfamily)
LEITQTLVTNSRSEWRDWLLNNHACAKEIWLINERAGALSYLDSVEEAICFGWIDSIAKRTANNELAQRFSPRRPKGNWTELNKARARRLISLGLMTEAGLEKLPSLEMNELVPADIVAALQAAGNAFENFKRFAVLYRAVRIGYIEEVRKTPDEFDRRLNNFVKRTALNEMFGNWNDEGRLF